MNQTCEHAGTERQNMKSESRKAKAKAKEKEKGPASKASSTTKKSLTY
jgi:hypothetical protein